MKELDSKKKVENLWLVVFEQFICYHHYVMAFHMYYVINPHLIIMIILEWFISVC